MIHITICSLLLLTILTVAQEAPHIRSYFYIGGEYVNTFSGLFLSGQMYVEKLIPASGCTKPYPIIFIHGGAQTGTNWLNKPDGNPGWASHFLSSGYEVYLLDQTNTGRSGYNPSSELKPTSFAAEYIQQRFTAIKYDPLWEQAKLHTQWPGTGLKGDPFFDTYYTSTVPSPSNSSAQELSMKNAGALLLDKIGPAVIIAHSQGSLSGWLWADSRPDLVKALVQIEPKGPPFREAIFSSELTRPWGLTSIPLTYSPPPSNMSSPLAIQTVPASSSQFVDCTLQAEPARQLVNLKNIPILIESGEASYHATYDHCFVEFLRQAGCEMVEHLELASMGIRGNGHLQFLERNSDEIVRVLEAWIEKIVA
ncbi:Alpha/Beta hydrolase protein [Rhexocercosporidium sp. MPI-PUGE-AT-0058]|nr:Alpha/Beta hydrolase protein [Rhexocercosporidium sp. MPI-PUGE-AT-0058]